MTQDGENMPAADPALEKQLSDLLRQIEGEPVPPHLHDLAMRLERALAAARPPQKTPQRNT